MKATYFICVLVIGLSFTFNSCNQLKTEELVFPDDKWQLSTPEEQGVNSDSLKIAIDYIIDNAGAKGVQHTIIIRNGYSIFQGDSIDAMVDTRNNPVLLNLTSGLLYDEGKFELDDLAVKYEKRLDCKYEEYKKIKIRNFLNRTSGYDAEGGRFHWWKIDGSLTPFVPGKPLSAPGDSLSSFHDSGNMFGLVMTKVAGEPLDGIISKKLMSVIGIDEDNWFWGDHGEVDGIKVNKEGENEFLISANNFARIGYLLLNKGLWKEQQVISSEWIDMATSPQVPFDIGLAAKHKDVRGHLGFFFVTNEGYEGGEKLMKYLPEGLYFHKNWKTNLLIVIPEWNMVIVRLGDEEYKDKALNDKQLEEFLELVQASIQE